MFASSEAAASVSGLSLEERRKESAVLSQRLNNTAFIRAHLCLLFQHRTFWFCSEMLMNSKPCQRQPLPSLFFSVHESKTHGVSHRWRRAQHERWQQNETPHHFLRTNPAERRIQMKTFWHTQRSVDPVMNFLHSMEMNAITASLLTNTA